MHFDRKSHSQFYDIHALSTAMRPLKVAAPQPALPLPSKTSEEQVWPFI